MLVFHPFSPWKQKLCGGKRGWKDQGSIFHQPPTLRTEGPLQIWQEAEKTRVPVVCVSFVWRLSMGRGECRQRVAPFIQSIHHPLMGPGCHFKRDSSLSFSQGDVLRSENSSLGVG